MRRHTSTPAAIAAKVAASEKPKKKSGTDSAGSGGKSGKPKEGKPHG